MVPFFDGVVANTLVRPLAVIMFDVLQDGSAQHGFIEEDELVQAFVFYGSDKTFSVSVHLGCEDGCALRFQASVVDDVREAFAKFGVVVVNQELSVA